MHVVEPVPIELDKPRSILLTLPALKAIEDQIAKQRGEKRVNLFRLLQEGDLGAMEMLVVLWGGLRHEEPGLTLEKTLAICAKHSMQAIAEAVKAAMEQHIGKPEPAASADAAEAVPGGEGETPPPLA
jgi:hypothetical protein